MSIPCKLCRNEINPKKDGFCSDECRGKCDQNTFDMVKWLNRAIENGERFYIGDKPNEIVLFDGRRDDIRLTNTHGGGTWHINDYQ